ncbi:hypothetical protein [Streptomyces sp. NPDC048611]|uniref:hypothetical protein n=1 Tax=Streptomyces sp. NPDC048611 TaxID=3155635 RepID=UPI00343EB5C7
MTHALLIGSGFTLFALALIGQLFAALEPYEADGVRAIGCLLLGLSAAPSGDPVAVAIDASLFAYSVYRWWTGGGGDGTKRRLRSAWQAFVPVRRTAPQGA